METCPVFRDFKLDERVGGALMELTHPTTIHPWAMPLLEENTYFGVCWLKFKLHIYLHNILLILWSIHGQFLD